MLAATLQQRLDPVKWFSSKTKINDPKWNVKLQTANCVGAETCFTIVYASNHICDLAETGALQYFNLCMQSLLDRPLQR